MRRRNRYLLPFPSLRDCWHRKRFRRGWDRFRKEGTELLAPQERVLGRFLEWCLLEETWYCILWLFEMCFCSILCSIRVYRWLVLWTRCEVRFGETKRNNARPIFSTHFILIFTRLLAVNQWNYPTLLYSTRNRAFFGSSRLANSFWSCAPFPVFLQLSDPICGISCCCKDYTFTITHILWQQSWAFPMEMDICHWPFGLASALENFSRSVVPLVGVNDKLKGFS